MEGWEEGGGGDEVENHQASALGRSVSPFAELASSLKPQASRLGVTGASRAREEMAHTSAVVMASAR